MPDLWEPTADDIDAYHAALTAHMHDRQPRVAGDWRSPIRTGLRAAFASLRARVGDPIPGHLISAADEPVEYGEATNLEELSASAAHGWRFVAQCFDAAGDPFMLLQRPRQQTGGDDG